VLRGAGAIAPDPVRCTARCTSWRLLVGLKTFLEGEATGCLPIGNGACKLRTALTAGLTADAPRIYSVIDSIISNAINYSKPPRKIEIVYLSEANDTEHRISVQDNGIGIRKDQISSIFEPFQLADATVLSRKYDHLGLSLSVAKKIVQLHGGDITVESTVNVGSTFTIHLPKELPHDP